jgi:ankyrin repeat protein
MAGHLRYTSLHSAAHQGNLARVQELVTGGAHLDVFDEGGKTPLHYAAENDFIDVVRYLIEAGANVNAHEPRVIGDTTLGAIAGNCSLEMAKLLIAAGADPTIRGWMQLCALDKAKERKRGDGPHIYKLMLDAAARPDRKS